MSFRRMMLFTLGAFVQSLIDSFKTRVATTFGIFESESCLKTQLDDLNDIGVLSDATAVITPNAFNESILHSVIGNTITPLPNNLLSYTETFNLWSLNAVTTTTTNTTNPFGVAQNITTLAETATSAPHRLNSTLIYVPNAILTYTGSVYLKKGSGATSPNIVQLYLLNGFNVASYANFNINTGVVTATNGCTATIDNTGLSSGWWRCSFTISSTTETSNCSFNIAHVNNNAAATRAPSYLGATTSTTLIWGAQLEISSSVTTYQPVYFTPILQQGYAEFTRTSTATRINSLGIIEEVPSENIFSRSQEFESSAWSRVASTIDRDVEFALNGALTTDLFNEDLTNNRHRLGFSSQISVLSGQTYNLSIYAKKASHDWIQINPVNTGWNIENWANFNLNTGTIGNTGVGAIANIENVGNGWYRLSLVCDTTITQLQSTTLVVSTNNTDSGRYPSYLGTGASCFYLWGAQMTEGSELKPYYPTILRQNTPRIDYSEDNCPTLLLESTVGNQLLRSEEFDNASWVKSNISVTQNTEVSPSNLLIADTLLATSNNATISQNGSLITSNTFRVFSVYLKRKTGTGNIIVEIGRTQVTASTNPSTWTRAYVIDTALTGTYTASAGLYTITTSVPHNMLTGDSVRVDITSGTGADSNVSSINVTSPTTFTFSTGAVTSSGNVSVYGNYGRIRVETSGDEVYVWGAQLEIGMFNTTTTSQIVPTSYIPTTNNVSTRNADNLVIKNSINTQKTFYFNLKRTGGTNNSAVPMLYLGNGPSVATSNNSIICSAVVGGFLNWYYKLGATTTTLQTSTIFSPNADNYVKIIVTVDNSSPTRFNIWMNGVYLVASSASVDAEQLTHTLLGLTQPILRLKEFDSWDRVLTQQEIDDLFAYPYYNAGYTPVNYELQNIINRAYFEGFTIPSTTILGYCDTLITEMKNDGVWSLTDLFLNFTYNDTNLSGWSRINWKQPNSELLLATLSGGLTYQTNGFKGNGTDGFINTNYNLSVVPTNYTLNNAGRMIVISEDATVNTMNYDGTINTNRNNMVRNNTTQVRINSSTGPLATTFNMVGVGLKSIMRDSSTDVRVQNAASTLSTTQTSTLIENTQQLILRSSTAYADACVSSYYLGASLTNAQINNFRTYYNTYLTNIGLTSYA